jgi:small subunit ribosomal protein S8
MENDKISDMLTQIRNALGAQHRLVIIDKTRITLEIVKILYKQNYIISYEELKEPLDIVAPRIVIGLKYVETKTKRKSAISMLQRISRPGLRIYNRSSDLPHILGNYGIAIVSTSKGIMTNIEAKKLRLGGEILCYIW